MGNRSGDHHTMAALLRSGARRGGLLQCAGLHLHPATVSLPGGLATRHRWQSVLPAGQFGCLLSAAHVADHALLCAHLDKGLDSQHTRWNVQGCANGSHAAEEQGEGHQDARGCCHSVCALLAAALRDLCAHQVWLGYIAGGVRDTQEGHAGGSVAGLLEQLHQSDTILGEQEVSTRLCGHHPVAQLLRTPQVGVPSS